MENNKGNEGKEVEVVQNQNSSPAAVIEYAMKSGAKIEELEKLLTLQERYDANQAKKVYNIAMADVHKKMPAVVKSAYNQQTKSKNARLEDIIASAKPIYAGEGFSVCFYEGDTEKPEHVRLMMDITHSAGHKETYHYDMPLDGKGLKGNVNMTPIHGKSSSVAYGRRYLLCMGLNLATYDDDGNAAGGAVEYINDGEQHMIMDLILAKGSTIEKFCKAFKIEDISELPATDLKRAVVALNAKKAGKVGGSK